MISRKLFNELLRTVRDGVCEEHIPRCYAVDDPAVFSSVDDDPGFCCSSCFTLEPFCPTWHPYIPATQDGEE